MQKVLAVQGSIFPVIFRGIVLNLISSKIYAFPYADISSNSL
jgi:hypothetical protein